MGGGYKSRKQKRKKKWQKPDADHISVKTIPKDFAALKFCGIPVPDFCRYLAINTCLEKKFYHHYILFGVAIANYSHKCEWGIRNSTSKALELLFRQPFLYVDTYQAIIAKHLAII